MSIVLALAAAAALVAIFVAAHRRGRLMAVTALTLAAAVLVLAVTALVVSRDYRDADGFFDCWPGCTALQNAVAVALLLGGVAFVVSVAGLAVAAATRGSRRAG